LLVFAMKRKFKEWRVIISTNINTTNNLLSSCLNSLDTKKNHNLWRLCLFSVFVCVCVFSFEHIQSHIDVDYLIHICVPCKGWRNITQNKQLKSNKYLE
jgi:hypothetical protein